MVDLASHMMTDSYPTTRVRTVGRSVAHGLVIAMPLSLALWTGIVWATVHVI